MQCLSCSVRPICKIYEFTVAQASIAKIDINNCTMFNGLATAPIAPVSPEIKEQEPELFKREPEEIISISEEIRMLSKPQEEKVYVQCSECEEEVESTAIKQCSKCMIKQCATCMVIKDGQFCCEECFFEGR